jgi:ABC-type multidrug transport system ATPase subunit
MVSGRYLARRWPSPSFRGTTVFLNSHLLGEVEATCDRVAFVKQGRIIAQESIREATSGQSLEARFLALMGDDQGPG